MDANISAPRFMPSMPFEGGGGIPPPYSHPHPLHNQQSLPHTHPIPPPNPFSVSNNQRFDANWFANFPPPPPPPPFAQIGAHPSFDSPGPSLFPQLPFLPQTTSTPPQNAAIQQDIQQEKPQTPSKEHAKEAILSLVRAEITYNDLVDEGIKVPVLNALFAELNLPLPKPAIDPIVPPDPAMERKDRIARLLAAKKSQSAAPSPKEPLQPIEPVDTPDTALPHQTPLTSITKEVIQEKRVSDFSIPGLFMTSAEQEEILPSVPSPKDLDAAKQVGVPNVLDLHDQVSGAEKSTGSTGDHPAAAIHQSPLSPDEQLTSALVDGALQPKSLKRGPEPFSTSVMPQAKRQVSVSQDTVQPSDFEKAGENGLNTVRSKINQNILKDRMAALKADLLLKNSRKKALQDGMPVLNAEVQKTRERLQENQERLREVRTEIESKSEDLARLREEESRLHEEVRQLESQLADGETGQRQFSKELVQLNDQILADENESRASQRTTLLGSPVTGRIETSAQLQSIQREVQSLESTAPANLPPALPGAVSECAVATEVDTLTVPGQEEAQRTETEYSPEQEDLDRQLNFEATYTVTSNQQSDVELLAPSQSANDAASQQFGTTPSEIAPEGDSDDDRMSIDEGSQDGSVGSASMSDSGSDEYEPPAHVDSANSMDDREGDEYEPQEVIAETEDLSNDADNDEYEPSDQVNILNVDALEDLRRDEDPMVVSTADHPTDDLGAPTPIPPTEKSETSQPQQQVTLVPVTEESTQEAPQVALLEPLSNSPESVPGVPHFVPYSSPLSNTRHFRFNPQFNEVVKNGYRSLTYSHQINKDIPLCPTELNGGSCEDAECEEQHFDRFALSGAWRLIFVS